MSNLFEELKRRNVFRVAVAYIVSAWLILQVADVVLNNIDAPDWVFSVFMLALALGFPPVMIFSWAYEITPEGVKRESEVDRSHSITHRTGRKLNQITIGLLVIVVAFVFVERAFLPATDQVETAAAKDEGADEVTATAVDDKSIAVLAFDDLSAEGDQEFFAEGLSEELLNVLAQVPDLKVAGRTSSFAFKGKDADIREIGEVLNVATVLEGSVRKAGNRIRVTAQLIKASDGFHLFSQTYDRNLDDIFQVQDELAALIGTALKSELTGGSAAPAAAPTDIEGYDSFLLARQHIRTRNPELMTDALKLLDETLEIDPDYVPAIVQKALATSLLSDAPGSYGTIPNATARAEARALLDRALQLDPSNAEAYAVLGMVLTEETGDNSEADKNLRHALALNPNLESAKLWLANVVDDIGEMTALLEDVALRDPMYGPAFNNLIQVYLGTGDLDKAGALVDRVSRITGPDENVQQALGTIGFMRGELADAARHYQVAYDVNPNSTVVRVWRGSVLLQLGELEQLTTEGPAPMRLAAFGHMGDIEAAERLLDELDFRTGNMSRNLWFAADYLNARGRSADVIDIVDSQFGGPEALNEAMQRPIGYGLDYQGAVAYAYLQEGRDAEFRLMLADMKTILDQQRSMGIDNWFYWISEAQYAALSGDVDAAVAHMRRAADDGYVAVFEQGSEFDLLHDEPRFRLITADIRARADEERAKLGLDPYRPVSPTN